MNLTFLHHSTYLLETDAINILFDAYRPEDIDEMLRICDHRKPLWVLCTHSHSDHFDPCVFSIPEKYNGEVDYLFHVEVREHVPSEHQEEVIFIEKGETKAFDLFEIKAYGSTDEGGSFRITFNNDYTLFYAGDLNNWHWNEEADEAHIQAYEAAYVKELNDLDQGEDHFDLMMFPTDLRLGKEFLKGLCQLLEQITVDRLAPMHINGTMEDRTELETLCQEHNITLLFPVNDHYTHDI